MILQEEDLTGRKLHRKGRQDNLIGRGRKNHRKGRQPHRQRKTTSQNDNLTGRLPTASLNGDWDEL